MDDTMCELCRRREWAFYAPSLPYVCAYCHEHNLRLKALMVWKRVHPYHAWTVKPWCRTLILGVTWAGRRRPFTVGGMISIGLPPIGFRVRWKPYWIGVEASLLTLGGGVKLGKEAYDLPSL